jgi:PAT family beta-lactamase induction signal transducer AmpG
MGFETFTQGLGTGAFMALLLRMTQKRFSATQFALFSSMFGIPRLFGGPLAGFMVYGLGWTNFFWLTMAFGIPGLVLLYRFVPLGVREPHFKVRETALKEPLGARGLAWRGVIGGVVGTLAGAGVVLLLGALSAYGDPDVTFVFRDSLYGLLVPEETTAWFTTIGVLVFGVICGLLTAAVAAARHGAGRELAEEDEETETSAGAA